VLRVLRMESSLYGVPDYNSSHVIYCGNENPSHIYLGQASKCFRQKN
jgi:hypothetical protein